MAKPLLSLDPDGGAKSSGGLPGSMTPKPAAAMEPEAGLKAPAAHFGNATRTFRLAAERIAFALTVHEVDWQRARKLVAEPIEFTATVQDATLRPQLADEIIMAAEPVAFTATVQDVALKRHRVLKADKIAYSLTARDITTQAISGDPHFDNVVLLVPFNGSDGATSAQDLSDS